MGTNLYLGVQEIIIYIITITYFVDTTVIKCYS